MRIAKIDSNFKNSQTFKNNKTDNKSAKEKKQEDYLKYLEKRAYLEEKTETIDDLALGTLVLGLFMNGHNAGTIKPAPTSQKVGVGLIISSLALIVLKCIKQTQLSKKYDENFK